MTGGPGVGETGTRLRPRNLDWFCQGRQALATTVVFDDGFVLSV